MLCEQDADGSCITAAVNRDQWNAILSEMARWPNSATCNAYRSHITTSYSSQPPRISVYNPPNGEWGDAHWDSNEADRDARSAGSTTHLWIDNFAEPDELNETLRHEAAHVLGNTSDESTATALSSECRP